MFIIVGLGNPGSKYASNRHNIGFMAIDEIAQRHFFSPFRQKFKGKIAEGQIAGVKTLLLKPQTFMNDSGRSVREALQFYKTDLKDCVIIYDELDIAPGKVKLKKGGGSGGHNGIKSIDAHCGKNYRRLRLGIGHPGDRALVTNHVLSDFTREDQTWLDPLLTDIARCVDMLATGEDSNFLNKLALRHHANAPKSARGLPNQVTKHDRKGQRHIRQSRESVNPPVSKSGPMADILKKFLWRQNGP